MRPRLSPGPGFSTGTQGDLSWRWVPDASLPLRACPPGWAHYLAGSVYHVESGVYGPPALRLVYAEIYTTLLAQFGRDVTTTYARAEAAMALAAAQGLGLRVAQGRILQGWALAMQGDAAA